jgi:hypothetical protein
MGPAISKAFEGITDVAQVVSAIRDLEARAPLSGDDVCIYKHTHT